MTTTGYWTPSGRYMSLWLRETSPPLDPPRVKFILTGDKKRATRRSTPGEIGERRVALSLTTQQNPAPIPALVP